MATNFSLIILVGLLAGIECRSVTSSSLNEATPNDMETHGGSRRDSSSKESSVSNVVDDYTKNFTSLDDKLFIDMSDRLDIEDIRRFLANQGLNLEKILADFAARTADFKDYEERAAQWLGLLKQMLQSLSSVRADEKSRLTGTMSFNDVDEIVDMTVVDDDKQKKIPIIEYNWLGDLLEFLDEQDIDGQSSDDNESHVKSRYDNSSTLFSLLDESTEENKEEADVSGQEGLEVLDNMLVKVRNDIERIQRYFKILCSKHHTASSTRRHVDDDSEDGPSYNNVRAKKI